MPEALSMTLRELTALVQQGEGLKLEFKRKANHPDKITRELVAFLNTEGGLLLVGVDDDRTIYGCKFPEEDAFALRTYLDTHCVPRMPFRIDFVRVNPQRAVLVIQVPKGRRKPFFAREGEAKQAYVRVADMSITASREVVELLRRQERKRGETLTMGDREQKLLGFLAQKEQSSFEEIYTHMRLPRRQLSGLLVAMAHAGVILIQPTRQGDVYALAPV